MLHELAHLTVAAFEAILFLLVSIALSNPTYENNNIILNKPLRGILFLTTILTAVLFIYLQQIQK